MDESSFVVGLGKRVRYRRKRAVGSGSGLTLLVGRHAQSLLVLEAEFVIGAVGDLGLAL